MWKTTDRYVQQVGSWAGQWGGRWDVLPRDPSQGQAGGRSTLLLCVAETVWNFGDLLQGRLGGQQSSRLAACWPL